MYTMPDLLHIILCFIRKKPIDRNAGRTLLLQTKLTKIYNRICKNTFFCKTLLACLRRKLLLREIELLQLFGAVAQNSGGENKVTSPLIRAAQVVFMKETLRNKALYRHLTKSNS
ncbi:hypothetical protein ACLB2K_033436 [Fragaria x ananassa]